MLNIGEASLALGLIQSRLRTLCKRNLIPFTLVGNRRIFDPGDLEKIRQAAIAAKYLPQQASKPTPVA